MPAELDKSEILEVSAAITPLAKDCPVVVRGTLIRARTEIGCEFVWRRQLSPHQARGEKNDSVGEVFSDESCAGRTGQNQTRHIRHRP
jgi:hypothetical protein